MITQTLLTVMGIRQETDDCVSILFAKPEADYQAGDCLDISFIDQPELGRQTYSFASSPTEQEFFITYKKGISDFKKKLQAVLLGQQLQMTQFGSNFVFDASSESVMIAGGVGIAPLRSMIKMHLDTKPSVRTILLYQNKTSDFPYLSELKDWQENYPELQIHLLVTSEQRRLTKEKILEFVPDAQDFHYYVAGPPRMVDATMDILAELGIHDESIHTDSFDGYVDEIYP